jgi:heat shock protein HslJ
MALLVLLSSPQGAITQSPALTNLPATFAGNLPCADCPGIRYQLDLYPDGTFLSRMAYEDRKTHFDDRGRWEAVNNGKVIALHGTGSSVQKLAVDDHDTLRQLDSNGNEIVSKLNFDLKRAPKFAPIPPQENVKVSLENTDWMLTRLGNTATPTERQHAPHFVLDPKSHRVSGSSGCNRLMGSYEAKNDQLRFSQMAGTRMACVEGMDSEKAFLEALSQVHRWKITGRNLELLNEAGDPVARFTASDSN